MISQVSLSNYARADTVSQKYCKRCRHLTRQDGRYYCKLLGAFLADQTLSQSCDLLEVQK